ncbi:helix-turn-helix transcriptional regulator [Bifidobacterium pseudolongum]|uniref:Helix-turn-helix transcriptional regulator n=2 Tax=Bifidobacterium pseudolongum TaxID=1694 RepID=A0A4S4F6G5_9BIFI|nr:helix-turn-helix transcriptional regulator [Bifidobacterium pseudolongum]
MSNSRTVQQNTGDMVARLMGYHRMSQKDVAAAIGCSRSAVSQKCAGKIRFSSAELLILADLFGTTTDALLGRDSEEAAQ